MTHRKNKKRSGIASDVTKIITDKMGQELTAAFVNQVKPEIQQAIADATAKVKEAAKKRDAQYGISLHLLIKKYTK